MTKVGELLTIDCECKVSVVEIMTMVVNSNSIKKLTTKSNKLWLKGQASLQASLDVDSRSVGICTLL